MFLIYYSYLILLREECCLFLKEFVDNSIFAQNIFFECDFDLIIEDLIKIEVDKQSDLFLLAICKFLILFINFNRHFICYNKEVRYYKLPKTA